MLKLPRRTRRCFGFHDWTPWSPMIGHPQGHHGIYQDRSCPRCGAIQLRRVEIL